MITVIIILGIQLVYVSFFTLRMILMLKGRVFFASLLSSVEVFVYLTGLSLVINSLNNPLNVAAYCGGYAMGVVLGSKIEEWMALGFVTVEVITRDTSRSIPEQLRNRGYGVTNWLAEGREGSRQVLKVLTKRRNLALLQETILSMDDKAFIVSYEPKAFNGGFLARRVL
ncbi:hypothetical protein SY88_12790 [Clostridiales bacterium PH28_bin88]|nr:hypothetical protein SY88_12790 [Clostridiales bacterium PH28_bin88]